MTVACDWRALLEALPQAAWVVDASTLKVVAANEAAGRLLGRGAVALLGLDAVALAATPEDLVFWHEAADGAPATLESDSLARRLDGAAVPVTRRIVRVELGGAAHYLVALHDRSAQLATERELERTAAELAATLESTADGILVTDLAGRIRHCNRRFAELWGLPAELLARRDDDALLEWMLRSVADPGAYMRRLAQLDGDTLAQATDRLLLRSGSTLERITRPQCSHGQAIGRVSSFRSAEGVPPAAAPAAPSRGKLRA